MFPYDLKEGLLRSLLVPTAVCRIDGFDLISRRLYLLGK